MGHGVWGRFDHYRGLNPAPFDSKATRQIPRRYHPLAMQFCKNNLDNTIEHVLRPKGSTSTLKRGDACANKVRFPASVSFARGSLSRRHAPGQRCEGRRFKSLRSTYAININQGVSPHNTRRARLVIEFSLTNCADVETFDAKRIKTESFARLRLRRRDFVCGGVGCGGTRLRAVCGSACRGMFNEILSDVAKCPKRPWPACYALIPFCCRRNRYSTPVPAMAHQAACTST
ncbi:hypothetical protein EVAR_28242_1 [Eumeta japonica]|uniref:Uncharacterized protein n=1 Tax=Eumeta variegata TaxID=151549 RepID=A0A4C1V5K8_EUMVA|nr:hypothetical protein EVAR_28242_1 [Eumeta japonica]